jgi:ADP-ribose pyrophosphatase YjhB (NUDIX family)
MNKKELFDLLENAYKVADEVVSEFKKLIEENPDNYYGKENKKAHITGSVIVFNEDYTKVLLVHHGKFNKWLQPGGHWMDQGENETIRQAAIREVMEECYSREVEFKLLNDGNPINLNIHQAGDHKHYDVTFLIEANEGMKLIDIVPLDKRLPGVKYESNAVEWKSINELLNNKNLYEPELVIMVEKSLEVVCKQKMKFKK